jgi:hypothetical protein
VHRVGVGGFLDVHADAGVLDAVVVQHEGRAEEVG